MFSKKLSPTHLEPGHQLMCGVGEIFSLKTGIKPRIALQMVKTLCGTVIAEDIHYFPPYSVKAINYISKVTEKNLQS